MNFKDYVLKNWQTGQFSSKRQLAKHIYNKTGLCDYKDFDSMRRSISYIVKNNEDELEKLGEDLRKGKQRARDLTRITNKENRHQDRLENAIEGYGRALCENLKTISKGFKMNLKKIKGHDGGTGIIQITDVHANELIDLPHNQYNFEVVSKRLKKLINESIEYFKYKGVNDVLIAFTGDLLNSDRRLDELLNQATNRSKASVIAFHLFSQAILEVSQYYPVKVVSVLGNESRVNKEMTFSNEAFSDNYDFTIMAMCKEVLKDNKNIKFAQIDQMESVVDFGKQKWLIAHDITRMTDTQAKTQSAMGRYRLQGIDIDFIIGGHIHAFRATDISCRSGSMSGSNSYNENALNLAGRASGVCYVVQGVSRSIQYIDLQDYNNEGYEFESRLEAYNVKSHQKCKQNTKIIEIVV